MPSSEATPAGCCVNQAIRLTVKLRGRPEALIKRRGRILSSRARGADTQAVHGPLQRLLAAITPRRDVYQKPANKPHWHREEARKAPRNPKEKRGRGDECRSCESGPGRR